jgi:transcriptional regulator with XRE-family HTH domain
MNKMEYQKTIVRRIKEFRLQKGISQRQLALSSGKDPQSLERVENGKSCPTVFY